MPNYPVYEMRFRDLEKDQQSLALVVATTQKTQELFEENMKRTDERLGGVERELGELRMSFGEGLRDMEDRLGSRLDEGFREVKKTVGELDHRISVIEGASEERHRKSERLNRVVVAALTAGIPGLVTVVKFCG